MKPETKVTAKITVEIAGQTFELSTAEAKKLREQLDAAIPERTVMPYPKQVVERPVYIPVPYHRQDQYREDRLRRQTDFPPMTITCVDNARPYTPQLLAAQSNSLAE